MRKLRLTLAALGLGILLAAQGVTNSNGAPTTMTGAVAVTSLPALPSGSNTIGAVTVASTTANQGTPASVSNGWPVYLESSGSALATNNDRLISVADGINQGGSTTDLRIDGWGDGVSTSYGAALTSAQLAAYNGNSSFDRLRSTTADNSAKTGVLEANPVDSYAHISGAATTAVKGTAGILHKLVVNTAAAGTVGIYDVASGICSGTPSSGEIAAVTLTSSGQPETLSYDVTTSNGICVVTPTSVDITVGYE